MIGMRAFYRQVAGAEDGAAGWDERYSKTRLRRARQPGRGGLVGSALAFLSIREGDRRFETGA